MELIITAMKGLLPGTILRKQFLTSVKPRWNFIRFQDPLIQPKQSDPPFR